MAPTSEIELRRLDAALADPAARPRALAELRALAESVRSAPAGSPLRLAEVDVSVGSRTEHLELLLLPTIFAPEAWAFTFLEGLLSLPLDEYEGRKLVEVGCGSGWICIALARFTALSRVVGVDVNPLAPLVARLNSWLNGGEDLAARVSFRESDLLRALPPDDRFDLVVGCIPQVLRGEEPEQQDLSNYTAIQNVYEDRFGLGLNARLLDEVPEHLAPGGRVILNLAGRPGRPIIERMFSRRGFDTAVLVARRVEQAGDTDIRPLVELEARTRQAFEFYVDRHSEQPIRAATALGWLSAGHPVWHEVSVWSAKLRLPRETLALRSALRRMEAGGLLADLDLSAASQEQLDVVAALARRLAVDPRLPYTHEAGDPAFRRLVARYLERYFGLVLGEHEIFVGPEREEAVHALLLATCDPGDGVLVSRNLLGVHERALEKAGVRVTVANDTLREIRRLLSAFQVKVLLLSVEPAERSNLGALREILDEARERGVLVVLDESAFFNITGAPEPRTLFEFLAREPHRGNLVVLYGLVKHAVYPDLELTLLLPVPPALAADLEVAAEVTYSRVGTLAQWLYERIFEELLRFRITFAASPAPPARPAAPLPRSRRVEELSRLPAFAPRVFDPSDPRLIRLDHGENEGPVPRVLLEGVVSALCAPRGAEPPPLAEHLSAFVLETRGVRYAPSEIVVAQGVWPLLHDLAVALRRRLGRPPRFLVAAPCYGVLPGALIGGGAEVELAPLAELRRRARADAIVISQPSNPEGLFLDRDALVDVAALAVESSAFLVSDEVFGLLHLGGAAAEGVPGPVTVEQQVPGITARTVMLAGLSKELAAGGLRVGFAALRDAELAAELRAASLAPLPLPAARAAAHVYAAYVRGTSGRLQFPERHRALQGYLATSRRELAALRGLITSALPPQPAELREPGGLFVAPLVDGWLGRSAGGVTLTPENLPRLLYERTSVVVNGGPWCGDPRRIRAVFSVPREKLEQAADRLREFGASLR